MLRRKPLRDILMLGLFMTFIQSSLPSAADTFAGFINQKDNQIYLIQGEANLTFPLRSLNQTTSQNLSKLTQGDFMVGHGDLINNEIILSSIDFVGLKKLLGVWVTSQLYSWVDFKDFTTVTTFLPNATGSKKVVRLKYSITPSEDKSWKVFFSDDNSIVLASLFLYADSAVLKFYDSENGNVSETIQLQKISGQ